MLVNLNGDLLAIGGNDGVQHVQQGVPSVPDPHRTTSLLPFLCTISEPLALPNSA